MLELETNTIYADIEQLRVIYPNLRVLDRLDRTNYQHVTRGVEIYPSDVIPNLRSYVTKHGPGFNLEVLNKGESLVDPINNSVYFPESDDERVVILTVCDGRKITPDFHKGFAQILQYQEPTTLEEDAKVRKAEVEKIQSRF